MRGALTIVLIILSGLFGNRNGHIEASGSWSSASVVQSSGERTEDNSDLLNRTAILPGSMARISEESNGHAPSVRNSESGRRIQPSTKSAFIVIKSGKVIDRNHFLAFQTSMRLFPSGSHSRDRYIHSICQLLI